MPIIIGRPELGICLNPLEYLLEYENGPVKEFENKEEAKQFLRDIGVEDEDALEDNFIYEDAVTGERN